MSTPKTTKNESANKNASVGRKVLNAVDKLQGTKGVSLPELKKFLQDVRKMDVPQHNAEIKLALKNGMDRGILTRQEGLYKVKEAARRRRRSRSKSAGGRKRRSGSRRKRSGSKRKRSGSRRKRSGSKKRAGSRRRRRRRTPAADEGAA